MDPKKALEYLNLKANQIVLAQEFSEKFGEYKNIVAVAISGNINDTSLQKYEDLRKWMIRKLPIIKDGLFNYKFNMSSVPTAGGQRVYAKDDILSLQNFNERLNAILRERDPSIIPKVASSSRYNSGYVSEQQQVARTIAFLNLVEDSLLGYLGALEA